MRWLMRCTGSWLPPRPGMSGSGRLPGGASNCRAGQAAGARGHRCDRVGAYVLAAGLGAGHGRRRGLPPRRRGERGRGVPGATPRRARDDAGLVDGAEHGLSSPDASPATLTGGASMDHPPTGPKDKGGNPCSAGWAPRRMPTSGRHLFCLALSPQPPRTSPVCLLLLSSGCLGFP
jgi:hypothetical protein